MNGCEGNTAFCIYRPSQPLEQSTSSSVSDMGGDSVSDQSWSMMNFHPISYGLSTTGMIAALMLVLVLSWCCIRNGGRKFFKKLRAPQQQQPDVVASNQEPIRFVPPRAAWTSPNYAPQGLPAYNAPSVYNPPVAASMPSLVSTTPTSPPLYDEITRMNQKLDKMTIADSVIKNNQYRIMNTIEKNENFGGE